MLTFFRIMLTEITPVILFLYNMGKVKNFVSIGLVLRLTYLRDPVTDIHTVNTLTQITIYNKQLLTKPN